MAECKVFSECPELRERVRADRQRDADAGGGAGAGAGAGAEDAPVRPAWHAVPFASVAVLRFLELVERLRREREREREEEEESRKREEMDETSGCWDTLEEVRIFFFNNARYPTDIASVNLVMGCSKSFLFFHPITK